MKDKVSSLINILGLTVGITFGLFLFMYVLDELSYDRYHHNAENIYRVVSNIKEPDNKYTWAVAQIPLGEELQKNYPIVKNAVRFFNLGPTTYKSGIHEFTEEEFYLADSAVFRMFTYEFIIGNKCTALDKPYSIVVTEKIARKYFGEPRAAFNQSLQNTQGENFIITGVMRDVPSNSHFRFDGLISKSTSPEIRGGWGNFGVLTYIQLPENYDVRKFSGTLETLIQKKVQPLFDQFNISISYELQRITDIHLCSEIQDDKMAGSNYFIVIGFGAIAIFFLLFVSLNYMKLANIRSSSLKKDRKLQNSMGIRLPTIVLEFFIESIVIAGIAVLLSLVFTYGFLPLFNSLTNKELQFSGLFKTPIVASLVGIVLLAGVVGSSYPALYLTTIRKRWSASGDGTMLPKDLLANQF